MVIVKNLGNGTGPPERNRSARTEQVRQLRPKSSKNFTDRKIDPVKLLRSEYWKFIGILYEKKRQNYFSQLLFFLQISSEKYYLSKETFKKQQKVYSAQDSNPGSPRGDEQCYQLS